MKKTRAYHVTVPCRDRAVTVPYPCRARAVPVPCPCRARAVPVPCPCRARAVTVTVPKWNDTAQNGIDFSSIVTPRERTQNAKEIAIIRNGNTIEWDCTCFFYAILYSTCIGRSALRLHRTVKNSVHVLRIFRNEVAHNSKGEIADVNFKIAIQNVITAFTNLSLDVTAIEDIKNETSFPTDELYTIQKQLKKEKKRNEEPQSFWVLPPKPSHVTIARHSEVDMIWQEMDGLRCLHVDEVTHVYLSGNPGCGKSEVARQIGERFFSGTSGDSTKRFVATLNASSISTLLQSYVDFANQLKCDEDYIRNIVSSKDFTQEEKIRNLIRQVTPKTEKYHSWLMIVDNVVDLPAISNFFPHAGQKILIGSGQILITTQDSQSIPPASSNMHEESLSNGMQEDDAVTALFEISDQREDRASALQVAKALDFQPLALACAGVYISWVRLSLKRSMKWKEYLLKIPEGKRKSMERPFKKTSRSYPETMTTAVEMAVEKVMKEDKFMMFTFQFLSVIAPEPIPMEYVVRYVLKCMPDEDEDEDFVAAHIARSSLVLISEDETSESTQIRLHQIVHTVLVGTAKQVVEGDFLSLVNVTESFSSLNIKDDKEPDYQFITETQTLVPHFLIVTEIVHKQLKLIASSKTFCIDKALSMAKCLSCAVGTVCKAHGQLNAAKTCYELSLLIKESMCEKSGFDLISELNKLAEVLIDLQTYEEAKKYLEQALADDELVRDENAPSYVRTLSNLGMVLAELGKYGEAEECLEKILAMKKCIDDDTLPFLGRILNCIGIMLSVLGRYEESKEFLEKAVDADQRTYGENHPYVSVRLSDLGLTMRELGQYREAKHYFERALTIHESIYGEDNKYLVIRLTNMGVVLKDIGHYQESKKYLERALAIDERTYDKLHPSLAVSLNNLGMILNDLGEYEEAKKYLERAHAIAKSKCKEDHPLFVASMNNVGLVLHGLGKYEEAKKTMESALAIVEVVRGPWSTLETVLFIHISFHPREPRDKDDDLVAAHIARSSLVLTSDDESSKVHVHQIVHELHSSLPTIPYFILSPPSFSTLSSVSLSPYDPLVPCTLPYFVLSSPSFSTLSSVSLSPYDPLVPTIPYFILSPPSFSTLSSVSLSPYDPLVPTLPYSVLSSPSFSTLSSVSLSPYDPLVPTLPYSVLSPPSFSTLSSGGLPLALRSSGAHPALFRSFSTVLLHVVFGLPLSPYDPLVPTLPYFVLSPPSFSTLSSVSLSPYDPLVPTLPYFVLSPPSFSTLSSVSLSPYDPLVPTLPYFVLFRSFSPTVLLFHVVFVVFGPRSPYDPLVPTLPYSVLSPPSFSTLSSVSLSPYDPLVPTLPYSVLSPPSFSTLSSVSPARPTTLWCPPCLIPFFLHRPSLRCLRSPSRPTTLWCPPCLIPFFLHHPSPRCLRSPSRPTILWCPPCLIPFFLHHPSPRCLRSPSRPTTLWCPTLSYNRSRHLS
ncbi:hypothetical protein QZH41_005626 [Actinostola sp. cb2023]|nr:hypothetical protein QZH41_005626 [Actinostola sp. cb2023]